MPARRGACRRLTSSAGKSRVTFCRNGYCDTFAELLETTEWERYGTESGNPKCANCMVHSGYEASAVDDTFGSIAGLIRAAKATLFGGVYADHEAMKLLDQPIAAVATTVPLTIGKSEHREMEPV